MTTTSSSKKATPTPRQTTALRRQAAFGDGLREVLRALAASYVRGAALHAAREAQEQRSRGVDRVPAHLDVKVPAPEYIHEHASQMHPDTGGWVKGMPYRNPDRIARLAKNGRLRKELR